MGKDLYETFPESRSVFDKADNVLGFSLSKLCFEGSLEELTWTQNCQPAVLTASIAAFKAFLSTPSSKLEAPNYAAGLSLGEYSALVAAEALSFEDAVMLTRIRGQLMEEEARKRPGKMAAVIGLDADRVKELCQQAGVEAANLNCPGQIVVSGGTEEIKKAEALAQEIGAKRVIVLETSGAFHSSYMQEAASKFAKELEKINISKPKIPVISNVTARAELSPEEIKENLTQQITSSVLWEDSMEFILSHGVRNFIEFGPGRVLKGLMRKIKPEAQVRTVEKSEDLQGE